MTKPKKKPILRCIHRHTIESHPSCFAKGKINYSFRDEKEWERLTGLPWYQYPEYRIGYLDIETGNLNANFGDMLSWAIKEREGDVSYDVITRKELMNGKFDKRIVESCLEEMKKYKILVTYYGTGFDIKYLRTKAIYYDLDFPGYVMQQRHTGNYYPTPEIYHFDLYYVVRGKLKLHRNSLAVATQYFGIEGKTPLKGETWRKAKYGDPKALEEVIEHNIEDVKILEELHNKLDFIRKWTRRSL